MLDRSELGAASGVERGALRAVGVAATPELILIATGSEVALALEAGRSSPPRTAPACASSRCRAWSCSKRSRRTTATRCCRPTSGRGWRSRPGVAQGWERWVGDHGDALGLDRFGASAPGATVLEELGFTAENVVARATAVLERTKQHV